MNTKVMFSSATALRIMQADFGVTDEEIKVAENIVFEKTETEVITWRMRDD